MTVTETETAAERGEVFRAAAYRLMPAITLFVLGIMILFACAEMEAPNAGTPAPTSAPPAEKAPAEARFESGVRISGVDIGGLTEYEAAEKLRNAVLVKFNNYECRLSWNGREFTLRKADVNLQTDLEEVMLGALKGGAGDYEFSAVPQNDAKLEVSIRRIAEQVDEAPKAAELITSAQAKRDGAAVTDVNERFAVTAAEAGREVDAERAAELVASGSRSVELPVNAVPANSEAPELPERRAYFATSFAAAALAAPNRVSNIVRAASMLNGASLAPGERLSCNSVLGERTEALGWLPATAFAGGGAETQQQAGGGICQVSTTLYNCAVLAGLDVTERHGHSRRVSYIPGGRDAALNWESADLVIENTTGSRVYLYLWVDEAAARLACEIYGEAFGAEYDSIDIASELIETIEPGEPEFITDDGLKPGECVLIRSAITGSRWATVRIYSKAGAEVRRERLDETAYAAHPAVYAVPRAGP